jgi:hypothetical protein
VTTQHWAGRINWPLTFWTAGIALAIAAIYHGRLWSRILLLAYTAGVGGFWLNRQFSTNQVIRLLNADGLLAGSLSSLLLLLGIPLLIGLCGNIYCGYLCPFGALQELLALIVPRRFKAKLSLQTIAAGRFIKYAVLAVLVAAFFVVGSKHFLEIDPLTAFFSRDLWSAPFSLSIGLIVALVALIGTLFVTRLWCRYLCPTGAFLSLFNLGGWLGKTLPSKKFGRCEFGLSGRDHLDCIHCDRCRYTSGLIPARADVVTKTRPTAAARLFLVGVITFAVLMLTAASRDTQPASSGQATEIIRVNEMPSPDSSETTLQDDRQPVGPERPMRSRGQR